MNKPYEGCDHCARPTALRRVNVEAIRSSERRRTLLLCSACRTRPDITWRRRWREVGS